MYENDNFSGYEAGNENTTGTFSGAELNETRTQEKNENYNTTAQSAAGSENGYTTYQMGGTTGSDTPKTKQPKKQGGYFRKALVSVSLGLFFGLFAGIGFYAVQQGTGMLKTGTDSAVVDEIAPEASTETTQSSPQLATNVTYVESDVSDVVEKVMPAMVSIVNNYTETANVFGQKYTQEEQASGSGIIVGKTDDELLMVSNNHVVEGADSLSVTFIDGSEAQAQIKGLDSDMDLAVIAVSLNDLSEDTKNAITVATLGNSDDLKLGEPVIAIGNALGYGQSVTNGIVSALNREITLENGSTGTFIQTNAAINPGNSGGALLNMNGEVIGINSNKIGGTTVEGMGYAIPITSASPIIADLMERQTRTKVADDEVGYIGISLQEVTSQISQMYNMPEGIYVVSVEEGSAAANAGIMKGDIITKFDGNRITSYADLQNVLQYYAAGDSATVTVQRPQNGEYVSVDLNLTLGSRPVSQK